MAGDLWEQAVENFLTIDRGLLLSPQYLIGEPGIWEANPDFLAVSFPESIAWMVEVTRSPRVGLHTKIKGFEEEYAPRIRKQLEAHRIIRGNELWGIGLWLFAPKVAQIGLQNRMEAVGIQHRLVTPLEETTNPDWDARFR